MYVIYFVDSGRLASQGRWTYRKVAQRHAEKMSVNLEHNGVRPRIAVMTAREYFTTIGNRTVKVRNLMTGAEVEENINTPYSCSVASESYWCN